MYKNINYPQHCNECVLYQEGLYVNEFTLQCPQYYHGIKSSAEQPAASLSAQDGGVAKIEEMGEVGYSIIST